MLCLKEDRAIRRVIVVVNISHSRQQYERDRNVLKTQRTFFNVSIDNLVPVLAFSRLDFVFNIEFKNSQISKGTFTKACC